VPAVKYQTGLLLIAVGAVLAFAVTIRTASFDPRTAGYLVIMAGVLRMALPRRASSRLRRGMLVRYYRSGTADRSEEDS
jgi:hypothetical protein